MTRTIGLCLTLGALALAGCDQRSPALRAGYEDRPAIAGTAFPQDETGVGDATIQHLLDGRVAIPPQAMIAVLPMDCGDAGNPGYSGTVQAQIAERVEREPNVLGVERIPTLVLPPTERAMPRVREACARLQCDLVLLYRVRQDLRLHDHLFIKDEAKSFATVEAILVDVRTGMIPWTDSVDTEVAAKQDEDHDAWESASTESVRKATQGMAEHLGLFFAKLAQRGQPAPAKPD